MILNTNIADKIYFQQSLINRMYVGSTLVYEQGAATVSIQSENATVTGVGNRMITASSAVSSGISTIASTVDITAGIVPVSISLIEVDVSGNSNTASPNTRTISCVTSGAGKLVLIATGVNIGFAPFTVDSNAVTMLLEDGGTSNNRVDVGAYDVPSAGTYSATWVADAGSILENSFTAFFVENAGVITANDVKQDGTWASTQTIPANGGLIYVQQNANATILAPTVGTALTEHFNADIRTGEWLYVGSAEGANTITHGTDPGIDRATVVINIAPA